MIVGDPNAFAIETHIAEVYESQSHRALGSFTIHVLGMRYGCTAKDATILACSRDAVRQRLTNRGSYVATGLEKMPASEIAWAVQSGRYGVAGPFEPMQAANLVETFSEIPTAVIWAPDGDAAFDDGSRVLQFDIKSRVRIVAFRAGSTGIVNSESIRDLQIDSEVFYETLRNWLSVFDEERRRRLNK